MSPRKTSQPTTAPTAEPTPYRLPSPVETGPKPDEIQRESENRRLAGLPNWSIAAVCAEWNVAVPPEFARSVQVDTE
jgi:hypothetical protein